MVSRSLESSLESPGEAPAESPAGPAKTNRRTAGSWRACIGRIEAFEDIVFDWRLVARLERQAGDAPLPPVRFHTPSFRRFETSEIKGCAAANPFPAFSITGGTCALNCDHCRAKILEPMIPATTPQALKHKVRELIREKALRGFLLSGGSNRHNEIAYERFYPTIRLLKREFPFLRVAVHSALLDRPRARAMEEAGVDVAMMDVIGSEWTIREVYHLDRPVADFEATLAALSTTRMEVVPHIVLGLHYGRLLGEFAALEIVRRNRVDALVLVVVMPFYAAPETPFATPAAAEIGGFFVEARRRLPDCPVMLGCARPAGPHKRETDAYAVMAGLNGIAFPADGAPALARVIGRGIEQEHACCSMAVEGQRPAGCAA